MPGVPTEQAFFIEHPLYEMVGVADEDAAALLKIQFYPGTVDAHCGVCETDSVFQSYPDAVTARTGQNQRATSALHDIRKASAIRVSFGTQHFEFVPDKYAILPRRFENEFRCTRCKSQELIFFSRVTDDGLEKIGQIPALADLHLPLLQPYRAVLTKSQYQEFAKGVGLSAHGVGIGAFVYLRRVFEQLVEEAHQVAQVAAPDWDAEAYERSRMSEKIQLLDGFLPAFLVENRSLYSIMSVGVHDLSEQECLHHFSVVQDGIESILEEKLVEERRAARRKKAARGVAALKSALGQREDRTT